MSRTDYLITRRIQSTIWSTRELDFAGLSCPKSTSTVIIIPKDIAYTGRPLILTVKVDKNEVTGTPSQIGAAIFGRADNCSNLVKYKTDKETWYLSDKLFILNGHIALMVLPNQLHKIIMSTELLVCCSPMAKLLKEKIVPNLVNQDGMEVQVMNTMFWNHASYVRTPIENRAKDILLEHLDEICNQQTSSGNG